MKILHLIGGRPQDGASKGAISLHEGLKANGVESKVLLRYDKLQNHEDVLSLTPTWSEEKIRRVKDWLIKRLLKIYTNRKPLLFSHGMAGYDITKHHEYSNADIVHLHWINKSFLDIKYLKDIKKPIVWTFRDMWPMTGGCHVAEYIKCQNFMSKCGNCKLLGSNYRNDFSRFVYWRKEKYLPKNLNIVTISNWLKKCAQASPLFADFRVRTIYNSIDTDTFYASRKSDARAKLGITSNKFILLVGSTNLNDPWKGVNKFIEALSKLSNDKYLILTFGNSLSNPDMFNRFETINFGYINDDSFLSDIYSAADVFVCPSIFESFGKTVIESMACGSPVVCFDSTGPSEIVEHRQDGYKARKFESDDLAKGINWLSSSDDYEQIRLNAIKKARTKYNLKRMAQEYIDLYSEIVK